MPPSNTPDQQHDRDAKLLRKIDGYIRSDEVRDSHDLNHYMRKWLDHATLAEATSTTEGGGSGGGMVWRFPAQNEYLNAFQKLSGGAQAAMHDVCTGWTLFVVARPGHWAHLGSSRTLNMSYLSAVKVGDELCMRTKIVSIGKRTAMIRGELSRESDGVVVSTSEHHLQNNELGSSTRL